MSLVWPFLCLVRPLAVCTCVSHLFSSRVFLNRAVLLLVLVPRSYRGFTGSISFSISVFRTLNYICNRPKPIPKKRSTLSISPGACQHKVWSQGASSC